MSAESGDPVIESGEAPPVFFLHVMKTAGTTVRHHIRSQFDDAEVYPSRSLDAGLHDANERIEYLRAQSPERHAGIRAYMGHFPYMVIPTLSRRPVVITVLRDPVDRVVSHLRHLRQYSPAHTDKSLEEIYEDPILGPSLLRNHQAKVFSLTESDRPESYRHIVDVDDDRLTLAQLNLDTVDIVGLTERFDDFLAAIERRLGWHVRRSLAKRVTAGVDDAGPALRRRIRADHSPDIELYAHARRRQS